MSDETDKPEGESRIAFSEFVLSIATNAIVHLGGDEEPDRVAPAVDLAQAAQYIDILMMLKEKTKGNLEKREEMLIDSLLYDLRMKYLEVQGRSR